MESPQQIDPFEQDAGETCPPEENLYLGTSGWSYADWEGRVYPPRTTPTRRLAEYVKHFTTVKIGSTFYCIPRRTTVERWRKAAPRGFLYAAKFPQAITHDLNLVGAKAETYVFLRMVAGLGNRLGPLLLQLPPSFTVEGMGVLENFLKRLPGGFRYAAEVRHRGWLGSDLPEMLVERGVALTLIDYPRMPRMEEATVDFVYIRWLGDRREFPSGHTHLKKDRDDDLSWWSGLVDRFLQEGRTVFAYANNHYQNHSPSTLARFLEIRRGEA